ncbi:AraC-like DNA-binding protein [Aequitasia blattaphilus]|uniref:AraC family transcriptional regulator n=1 Tax=Aequitasia blattaphilus TaxID=2949332 RepID=A0ABT1EAZ5_9FIRM|nr:AraC family transcriptional regulator [Aequitasia blattaphilus]MCP1103010.1 AraC family transcriptional regulator [Aequitasia blattaphilus]MCR8615650.1 AraC family transcriptional regulator [Aequitasia blattaphilus]
MDIIYQLKTDSLPHLTYLGENQVPENWKHFRRTTNEYIMYFINSGDFYIKEKNSHYHLTKGDVVFMEPGKEHIGYKEAACCYYYAHFSVLPIDEIKALPFENQKTLVQKLLQTNYNTSPLSDELYSENLLAIPKLTQIKDASSFHHIQTLFQKAVHESSSKKLFYKTLASCRLMEIFQSLSKNWINSLSVSSGMHISDIMYDKTDQLLDYLHTSYCDKITSTKLENLFSVNFDYLNRIFKKRTGNTIFSYLNNIRLEQAKQYLSTSRIPLKEIAARCGFSDEYYFSRFFKQQIGTPPSLYRRERS